jgi:limonene-1,2-epoxide hydrolase
MQGEIETVTGMDTIKEKGKKFQSMVEEMHSAYTNEPKVFGHYIFMEMGMDVTMKGMGRMDMKEMCNYEVKDGKIISERFYY